jgi:hypothetical protein
MAPRYHRIVLLLLLGCGAALQAQSVLAPSELTNRPLAIPNDASAVGWNPSLLGAREGTWDLLLALPFSENQSQSERPFAAFGRFGPAGVGVISGRGDSGRTARHYFGGFGWPAIKGRFWVGGGFRLFQEGSTIKGGGITLSGTIRPSSSLLASLTLMDPTG